MINKRKLYSIEILFKLSDEYKSYKGLFDKYIELLRQKYLDVNYSKFIYVKNKYNIDKFTKEVINIYDKKFTEEDIKNMTIFFQSETGKKLKDPLFRQEISTLSESWLQKIDSELSKISDEINEQEHK